MSISCNFLFPLYRLLSTDVDKLKITRFQLSSLNDNNLVLALMIQNQNRT